MEKTPFETAAAFLDNMQRLMDIAGVISRLEKITAALAAGSCHGPAAPEFPAGSTFDTPPPAAGTYGAEPARNGLPGPERAGFNIPGIPARPALSGCPRIIAFPVQGVSGAQDAGPAAHNAAAGGDPEKNPVLARPGQALPRNLADYRPLLQRDGLILLAWDKRGTGNGERYTAYWVTSAGISRYYASKPLPEEEFHCARPHHKSYAAEDGIEFYGQSAPACIIHVAPELMMSNPPHGELRKTHIRLLKRLGSTVDFDYKYLLSSGRKKGRLSKQGNGGSSPAGA